MQQRIRPRLTSVCRSQNMFGYHSGMILLFAARMVSNNEIWFENCPEIVKNVAVDGYRAAFPCGDSIAAVNFICEKLRSADAGATFELTTSCSMGKLLKSLVTFSGVEVTSEEMYCVRDEGHLAPRLRSLADLMSERVKSRNSQLLAILVDDSIMGMVKGMFCYLSSLGVQAVFLPLGSQHLNQTYLRGLSNFATLMDSSNTVDLIYELGPERFFTGPAQNWLIVTDEPFRVQEALEAVSPNNTLDVMIAYGILEDKIISMSRRYVLNVRKVGTSGSSSVQGLPSSRASVQTYNISRLWIICAETTLVQFSWPTSNDTLLARPHFVIKDKLTKCHFRVAVANVPPYTEYELTAQGKAEAKGMDMELLSESEYQLGFRYTVVKAANDTEGVFDGVRWSGLIGTILDEEAEIGLPAVMMTKQRAEVIDFSSQIYTIRAAVVIRKPPLSTAANNYMLPFDLPVWLLVVGFMVVTAVMLSVTEALLSARTVRRYNWWENFYTVLISMAQQGPEPRVKGLSSRIVFITFLFFVLIILSGYSSVLTSFLTVTTSKMPFTQLREFLADSEYQAGVLEGSSYVEVFKHSHSLCYKRIWSKKIKRHGKENLVPDLREGLRRICAEKFALIVPYEDIRLFLHTGCPFSVPIHNLFIGQYNFVMSNKFHFKRYFRISFQKLHEVGIVNRIYRQYFPTVHRSSQSKNRIDVVGLKNVYSLIGILLSGMCLAFVAFALEILMWKYSQSNQKFFKQTRATLNPIK